MRQSATVRPSTTGSNLCCSRTGRGRRLLACAANWAGKSGSPQERHRCACTDAAPEIGGRLGSKLLRILYRLLVPGGLVLLTSAAALRTGFSNNLTGPFWEYYPYFIFGTGLVLSALFKCSR